MARRHERPVRIVVDTNIFISFLIGKRLKELQVAIAEGEFQFVVGEKLLNEIRDVVGRPHLRKLFAADAVGLLMAMLEAEAVNVGAPKNVPAFCRDANVNYLLAISKAGKADVLLTGDDDLLVLGKHGRTRIMNARTFVKEFLIAK